MSTTKAIHMSAEVGRHNELEVKCACYCGKKLRADDAYWWWDEPYYSEYHAGREEQRQIHEAYELDRLDSE